MYGEERSERVTMDSRTRGRATMLDVPAHISKGTDLAMVWTGDRPCIELSIMMLATSATCHPVSDSGHAADLQDMMVDGVRATTRVPKLRQARAAVTFVDLVEMNTTRVEEIRYANGTVPSASPGRLQIRGPRIVLLPSSRAKTRPAD